MSLTTRDVKVHAEAASIEARGNCNPAPSRLPSSSWAQRLTQLGESAWGAALVRTASVVLTLVGLAAIGSASFAHSLAPASAAQASAMQANLLSVAGAAATAASLLEQPAAPVSASPPSALTETSASHAGTANANEPVAPPSAPTKPAEAGMTADGKIILNTANATQLDRLPSVGMKRAEQIVALRERLGGRFKSLNDLLRIKGIGVKTLKKMLPLLVLDPPKEPEPPEAPSPSTKG